MTTSGIDNQDVNDARPTGFVRPTHELALRAVAALEKDRVAHAEKHIESMPDLPTIDRAWKYYLRGRVAIQQMEFDTAEQLLLQASSLAFIDGLGKEGALDPGALRLAACALHHVGWIYRRQDRADEAYRAHLAAYHFRELHGSSDEMWETAIELGLDADLAQRYDDARRWHRIAIDAAEKASEEPARKQAIAWTNLASSFTESGNHDEAVVAARTARDWWRKHDIGAVAAARADLKLGSALLRQGEALHENTDERAKPVLEEAIECLTTAGEALSAFGPDHAADVQSCLELKDFAERLRDSLEA